MRIITILIGLVMVAVSTVHNFGRNPLPWDASSITFTIGYATISLDSLFLVVGGFLILIPWVFGRLHQED